ncbi:DUF6907 domain-containing protein [Nocardioides sp. Bht2]|uniref:DUF6907 domain-containing protein n=1 Tax=Nocardioides sp. Bht2 TaxID=3392297 RepID=UPI0039B5B5A0
MRANPSPSWQHDPCPDWCVITHHENDLVEDRFHDATSVSVPVVLAGSSALEEVDNSDLFLALFRRVGSDDDWLHISAPEADHGGFTVSLTSARRLGDALSRLPGSGPPP